MVVEPYAVFVTPLSPGDPGTPEEPEPEPEPAPDSPPTGVLVGPAPGLSKTIEPPVGTKGIPGAPPVVTGTPTPEPVVDGQMTSYVVLV